MGARLLLSIEVLNFYFYKLISQLSLGENKRDYINLGSEEQMYFYEHKINRRVEGKIFVPGKGSGSERRCREERTHDVRLWKTVPCSPVR